MVDCNSDSGWLEVLISHWVPACAKDEI